MSLPLSFLLPLLLVLPFAALRAARRLVPPSDPRARTLLVLGSGGHTAELLSFFEPCREDARLNPRSYVLAASDTSSEPRARRAEEKAGASKEDYSFHRVPRAREVGQSWATTPLTTAWAAAVSVATVLRLRPRLVVANGPGTCLPVCLAAALFSFLGVSPACKVVFVESFCRVRTLSLTGRALYPFASRFVVQWPGLVERYPRATYLGRIC